jgi:hypothetical protein
MSRTGARCHLLVFGARSLRIGIQSLGWLLGSRRLAGFVPRTVF